MVQCADAQRLVVWCCREVAKAVRLRKACTVVVAPNIEQIESEGGLDDLLSSILSQAQEASIPIVFALSRKKLGQVPHMPQCPLALSSSLDCGMSSAWSSMCGLCRHDPCSLAQVGSRAH
jgi:ribosomal protein L7Ae-like RNA K-turn-binding protein